MCAGKSNKRKLVRYVISSQNDIYIGSLNIHVALLGYSLYISKRIKDPYNSDLPFERRKRKIPTPFGHDIVSTSKIFRQKTKSE